MHRAKPKNLKGYLGRSLQRKKSSLLSSFILFASFFFSIPLINFIFRRFESAQHSEGFCPSLTQTWTKSQRNAASSDLSWSTTRSKPHPQNLSKHTPIPTTSYCGTSFLTDRLTPLMREARSVGSFDFHQITPLPLRR